MFVEKYSQVSSLFIMLLLTESFKGSTCIYNIYNGTKQCTVYK